jgi:hypothetical protein
MMMRWLQWQGPRILVAMVVLMVLEGFFDGEV